MRDNCSILFYLSRLDGLLVDLFLLEHFVVEEQLTENHRCLVLDLQSNVVSLFIVFYKKHND